MIVMDEELPNSFEDRVHFNLANWYFHYDKFTLTYIHHQHSTFLGETNLPTPYLAGYMLITWITIYVYIYIYIYLFIHVFIYLCYMIYSSSFCYVKCQ